MSDTKELKPKSFRIDDETAEKFKQISNELGNNQQATLSKLIETYEFQKGKSILLDKKDDIETFEKYVTLLTRMFMNSLEDNQNITETVRSEFDALLTSKDTTIQDLQEKVEYFKFNKKNSDVQLSTINQTVKDLTLKIKDLESHISSSRKEFENTLIDKDNLNKALTDSCNSLKERIEDLTLQHSSLLEEVKETDNLRSQNRTLQNDVSELLKKVETLTTELKQANSKLLESQEKFKEILSTVEEKSHITLEKALLELSKKHQEQIQLLNEEKQHEIDKYQRKYMELVERIENDTKSPNKTKSKARNTSNNDPQ